MATKRRLLAAQQADDSLLLSVPEPASIKQDIGAVPRRSHDMGTSPGRESLGANQGFTVTE